MVLRVHKDKTDCIDLDDIAKEFIQVNEKELFWFCITVCSLPVCTYCHEILSAWCTCIDGEIHEDTKRALPDSKKSYRQQKLSVLRAGHTDQLLRDSSYFSLYHRSLYISKKHEVA